MNEYLGVRVPSQKTLQRYGLSLAEWRRMVRAQRGLCAICFKLPASGILVIDHQHEPGWAGKPDSERKKAVRGLLEHTCNHFIMNRYVTVAKLRAAANFLARYERRRARDG